MESVHTFWNKFFIKYKKLKTKHLYFSYICGPLADEEEGERGTVIKSNAAGAAGAAGAARAACFLLPNREHRHRATYQLRATDADCRGQLRPAEDS